MKFSHFCPGARKVCNFIPVARCVFCSEGVQLKTNSLSPPGLVIQGLEVTLGVVVQDTGQVHMAQDVPETYML